MTLGESPYSIFCASLVIQAGTISLIWKEFKTIAICIPHSKILKNKFFVIIIAHLSDNHLVVLKNNPNFTPVINLK